MIFQEVSLLNELRFYYATQSCKMKDLGTKEQSGRGNAQKNHYLKFRNVEQSSIQSVAEQVAILRQNWTVGKTVSRRMFEAQDSPWEK